MYMSMNEYICMCIYKHTHICICVYVCVCVYKLYTKCLMELTFCKYTPKPYFGHPGLALKKAVNYAIVLP